ncbi:MAG: hypothetical protein Q4F97_00330 [Bacteroidales bacterium]|nr:hypothetical protein [Bacteroidales bacterium]
MKFKLKTAAILLFSVCTFGANAQDVKIDASIDSVAIMIGEQTGIHLEVTQNKNDVVRFPVFKDTIMKGIEVLGASPYDTIDLGNNKITVKQDLLVTSFDSALYYLPPFEFIVGNDTLHSNQVALKVGTYQVDTESKEFYDIKGIKNAPFVFDDYYWEVMGVLFFLFIIVWSLYFYKRWKYRKDHPNEIEHIAPKLPPHLEAMKALEDLVDKKLWQKGMDKEYYTALTDILRVYILERFDIYALEMTSSEILQAIKNKEITKSSISSLKQVLDLADYVKFAKMKPIADENELSIANAKMFISQTVEVETIDTVDAANKDQEA